MYVQGFKESLRTRDTDKESVYKVTAAFEAGPCLFSGSNFSCLDRQGDFFIIIAFRGIGACITTGIAENGTQIYTHDTYIYVLCSFTMA